MLKLSVHSLSSQARIVRWGLLGLCCTPLVGTYLYNQGSRLSFLVCPFKYWTGIPCPGCGLTRSFMAVAKGDWSQSFSEHLFGPLLFTGLAIATVHITIELSTGQAITTPYGKILKQKSFYWLSLWMVLLYYAIRLYLLSKSGELLVAFERSPLGQLLYYHPTIPEFYQNLFSPDYADYQT